VTRGGGDCNGSRGGNFLNSDGPNLRKRRASNRADTIKARPRRDGDNKILPILGREGENLGKGAKKQICVTVAETTQLWLVT